MLRRGKIRKYVLALTLIVLFATVAEACPTCKEAVADSGNHANVVRGYFWSILFMMSMPFLILGGLGTYFYIQVTRARSSAESAAASSATIVAASVDA
jgi:hypothetical protein